MTPPRPSPGLNRPVQGTAADPLSAGWRHILEDMLEWNEQWRYRDADGVVHRSLVATFFPGSAEHWLTCHHSEHWLTCHHYPHVSVDCVTVPRETPLTCIACIAQSPRHVDPNPRKS